jgi:opacity protein-like surface antigen
VIGRGHTCDHSQVLTFPCIGRASRLAGLVVLFLLVAARPAWADLTAFLGITTTPENRGALGFSGGLALLIVGFEFEYANTPEDEDDLLPGFRTWSGNVLLQTPVDLGGVQLYGTVGFGAYREELRDVSETSSAVNLGGGAKIRLVGPLRLRLDYRAFQLQGSPLHDTYHRFYAGANLRF